MEGECWYFKVKGYSRLKKLYKRNLYENSYGKYEIKIKLCEIWL